MTCRWWDDFFLHEGFGDYFGIYGGLKTIEPTYKVVRKHPEVMLHLSYLNLDHLVVIFLMLLVHHKLPARLSLSECVKSGPGLVTPVGFDHTGMITSTSTGKCFNSKKEINCQSNNLIYLITCKHCKIQYVGQTRN